MAVLCSKGPPTRKPAVFNEVTETAVFPDGEEHAFAAMKQSCLYRTFNAAQTESMSGPYEEVGGQKMCSRKPDHGIRCGLQLQLEDDSMDRNCLPGPDF